MRLTTALALFWFVIFTGSDCVGSDWPQFLGPTRDAVYSGPALAESWPVQGPRIVWSREVGQGYANPVVVSNRLVLSHRLADDLTVDCFDALTGKTVWTFRNPMKFQDGAYFDSGPRPTPSIVDGKVFIHNSDGYLVCLALADGKKIWARQVKLEFNSSSTWHGCVASPLVVAQTLILPVGGTNSGLVAFAVEDGRTVWQVLDDKASASSPLLASLGGKPQILVVTRKALRAIDPATGKELWQTPTRKQTSGNVYAASPAVSGDKIFLSGWYNLGAKLLQVKDEKPIQLWERDDAISTHYANAILHDGYIYGFHGHGWERGGPTLRCVEMATGKLMWEQPQLGSGTIIRCDDHLLILSENGELQWGKASPAGFKVISRAQVVGRTTRNYPAIADGYVYVKGPRKLVCVDLGARK